MFTTYNDVFLDLRRKLLAEKVSMPELEAGEMLRYITGKTREEFVRDKYLHASNETVAKAHMLCERRLSGEPLAYIIGEWDFYGITLKTTPAALIPRSDTETLVDTALRRANGAFRFLDLGCGCGCVGIALAEMRNNSRGVAVDVSDEALALAKENIFNQKLSSRISCIKADMLCDPPANLGKFGLIVSNPPYITAEEMELLPKSVSGYEPQGALYGGEDGLAFYRAICANWMQLLTEEGVLAVECGSEQSRDIEKIMEEAGGRQILTTRDNSGHMRVVSCIK